MASPLGNWMGSAGGRGKEVMHNANESHNGKDFLSMGLIQSIRREPFNLVRRAFRIGCERSKTESSKNSIALYAARFQTPEATFPEPPARLSAKVSCSLLFRIPSQEPPGFLRSARCG